MNYKYEIVRTSAKKEEGNTLPFGIKIVGKEGDTVCMAADISEDNKKMDELVRLCNKLELSPIHFYDVISDFIISENDVI